MGHKVNPKVFRLSTIYTWDSKWFARGKQFVSSLKEDVNIREYLRKALRDVGLDSIGIDRTPKRVTITIRAAKPGVIIGRAGAGIEELKKKLSKEFYRGQRVTLNINVEEVTRPTMSAQIIGDQIAREIEQRLPFRRSMKMAIERVMKGGAKGVKLTLSGRLNGSEIARTETIANGSIPLHNLRADIDFARVRANTIFGVIGVKVWIYRGDVFATPEAQAQAQPESAEHRAAPQRGTR